MTLIAPRVTNCSPTIQQHSSPEPSLSLLWKKYHGGCTGCIQEYLYRVRCHNRVDRLENIVTIDSLPSTTNTSIKFVSNRSGQIWLSQPIVPHWAPNKAIVVYGWCSPCTVHSLLPPSPLWQASEENWRHKRKRLQVEIRKIYRNQQWNKKLTLTATILIKKCTRETIHVMPTGKQIPYFCPWQWSEMVQNNPALLATPKINLVLARTSTAT